MAHDSYRDRPSVYEKEFYTNLDNIFGLLRLAFGIGSLIFGVFLAFLMMGAAQNPSFDITRGMLLFYSILGYGTGFGVLIMGFLLEHPNKWVTRATFGILFAIPIVLHFT